MYGYGAGSGAGGQSTVGIFLIIVAVIVLRVVRSGRQRPVHPFMLLLTSAVVLYGSAMLLEYGGGAATSAPRPTGIDVAAVPFYAVGALLGLAIGFLRGRTITFFRDAATGQVLQKSGPWAILIWVGLFALRYLVRYLAGHDLIGAWATPAADILLLLGTCSVLGRNLYSLLRYVQLSRGSGLTAIG